MTLRNEHHKTKLNNSNKIDTKDNLQLLSFFSLPLLRRKLEKNYLHIFKVQVLITRPVTILV